METGRGGRDGEESEERKVWGGAELGGKGERRCSEGGGAGQ